ncbi:MAG: sporulation protein YqfD [Eubacterium sp.]|nr:sporulation protein YqfD [Eubacterium sp.]
MVRFFRWILGYVCFRFSGGFIDGFINKCYENGINVQRLKTDNEGLQGECLAREYIKLHSIARLNGGRIRITKKHGFIFSLLRLKNRWGLLIGAVIFICFISFLSGFIWNVEITGNEKISESEIGAFLEENGVHCGAYWKSIDKNKVENLMLASFDEVAWVHINALGTTARVEINESAPKPEITAKTITNVKAKKDGFVVKASVTSGWAEAKVGDSVTKGDLLISGVYESEKKKGNQFAHASGEYIARVKEPFSLTVARKQSSRAYRQERSFKKLYFFGLKIPLYFMPYETKNSLISSKSDYLMLNKSKLPIGIISITERRYTVNTRLISDSELQSLIEKEAEKKLSEDFSDYEIVKKNIDISLNAEEAHAVGEIICLEDIGEEVLIKIKNK